jgi:hypothetical protein
MHGITYPKFPNKAIGKSTSEMKGNDKARAKMIKNRHLCKRAAPQKTTTIRPSINTSV